MSRGHAAGFPLPSDALDGGGGLTKGGSIEGKDAVTLMNILSNWIKIRGVVNVPGDLPTSGMEDGDLYAVKEAAGPGSVPALYIFDFDTTTWKNVTNTGLPAAHHATHESGPDVIDLSVMLAVPAMIHHVDRNYTGAVSNGSPLFPFKTIMAAVTAVAAIGDHAYHSIKVASGIYAENILLENLGLEYVKIEGDGYVSINPAAGNALQSTANNANLKALLLSNVIFAKPVVITGPAGGMGFTDVIWDTVKFTGTATLSVSCVNNFSMINPYSECDVSYVNVNWSYIESGQLQGKFDFTADDTLPIPSAGKDCTTLVNGVFQSGNVTYTIGGTGTQTVAVQGCRWGSTAAITVPAGVSILGYNSWLRGTHTNNGAITLRNAATEGYIAGVGTLTITGNPGSQIYLGGTAPGDWGGPGVPANVQDAVNRLAAQLAIVGAMPIP